MNMKFPTTLKEVQGLTKRLVALNNFILKVINKSFQFFQVIKKNIYEVAKECEGSFQELKAYLLNSPYLMSLLLRDNIIFVFGSD